MNSDNQSLITSTLQEIKFFKLNIIQAQWIHNILLQLAVQEMGLADADSHFKYLRMSKK